MKNLKLVLWGLLIAILLVGTIAACASPATSPPATTPKPALPTSSPPSQPAVSTPAPAPASPKSTPAPAPAPSPKLPDMVTIVTYSVGTGLYGDATAVREAIEKFSTMKARLQPAEALAQFLAMKTGQADFTVHSFSTAGLAQQGWLDWARPDWGPQRLATVWLGSVSPIGWMVRGDSGIRKLADLKGKRIADQTGTPTYRLLMKAMLAYNQFTWNDIVVKEFGSTELRAKAVMEGTADALTSVPSTAYAIELEASRYGVSFIDMPANDVEAWKRWGEIAPMYKRNVLITSGPATVVKNKPSVFGSHYGVLAYDTLNENTVYEVCKALDKGYNVMKEMRPNMVDWTLKNAVATEPTYPPFHPGAIRYFKETGVWNAELDKFQASALKTLDDLVQTYKKDPKAWQKKWNEDIIK